MIAKDKLYTEAEAVYRKFLAEDERIYRIGGVTEPTPVLLETTTGDYRKDSVEIYRDLYSRHSKAVGGQFRIAWIKREPGTSIGGSIVALRVCSDASSVLIGPSKSESKPGLIVEETGYFVSDGANLKLSAAQTKAVTKC
jgi:hypothetical protein